MKKQLLLTPVLLAGALAFASPAHADLLSFNTFNGNSGLTASDGVRPTTITLSPGSTGAIDQATASGSTINADADGNVTAVNKGKSLFVTTNSTAPSYIQFNVNTTGYGHVSVRYAGQLTGANGYTTETLQYFDGSTYQNAGTFNPTTSYGLASFDLSSFAQANDNAATSFRILFGGGTASATDGNHLDNLSVEGFLTPEPSTWAMMGLGIGAIAFLKRRRKRESGTVSFSGATA